MIPFIEAALSKTALHNFLNELDTMYTVIRFRNIFCYMCVVICFYMQKLRFCKEGLRDL